MKHLIKIIFLFVFLAPFSMATATTHDEATMEAIEHSSSDRFENDIDLPDTDDAAHEQEEHPAEIEHAKDEMSDDKDDSADDKDDSKDDKDDSVDDKDDSRDNSMREGSDSDS